MKNKNAERKAVDNLFRHAVSFFISLSLLGLMFTKLAYGVAWFSFDTKNEITTPSIFGSSPTWLDLYGRKQGIEDFCSVDEDNSVISCYGNKDGYFTQVLKDKITNNLGYKNSRIFVKQADTKDGKVTVGYCRLVDTGSDFRVRCNYYTAEKITSIPFIASGTPAWFWNVKVEDTGVLDKKWSVTAVIAGKNARSDRNWWVDLMNDGNYSYCRIVYPDGRLAKMTCRRFYGLDEGFAKGELQSDIIDEGKLGTRGWVKDFEGNSAFCRVDSSSHVHCLPFDKKTQHFKPDVVLSNINVNSDIDTFRWVDDLFDDKSLARSHSAFCRVETDQGRTWYACSALQTGDAKATYFHDVLPGWDDTKGFMLTPGSGTLTWCGLIDTGLNRINCGTLDVTSEGTRYDVKGVSDEDSRIDSGYRDIFNGNREWMDYYVDGEHKGILYCRKVNVNDMRCTRIFYNHAS